MVLFFDNRNVCRDMKRHPAVAIFISNSSRRARKVNGVEQIRASSLSSFVRCDDGKRKNEQSFFFA